MDSPDPVSNCPTISIIVPARNEEACLARCLESVVSQSGVSFEIIVVDDGSTDRSREIAESFRGVRVINAAPLRDGWIGKNNAVFTGANAAHGTWLLFTDADTVHYPGSLARALAQVQEHAASLLSYSPEQEVHSFWEKALMPVIFAELLSAYRPSEVNDPASQAAAANGQYLLVARDAYDAVGGHAAICDSLLEDVELARIVKTSGRKIHFRYGRAAVRTRMYRNFAQLREGWIKNLSLLFPSALKLAALRSVEFVLIAGSMTAAGIVATRGSVLSAIPAIAIASLLYAQFVVRVRRGRFSWGATALSIFGLPLFSYLLLQSQSRHRRGNVTWKGRTYDPSSRGIRPANGVTTASARPPARGSVRSCS